jgi:hypothetical protein
MRIHQASAGWLRGVALGVAVGVAAITLSPALSFAQDTPQRVERDQVPEAVRKARQTGSPNATDVEWYRTTRDGRAVYIAQFKGGGAEGAKRETRFAEDGKVLEGPGPAKDLSQERAPAPTPGAAQPAAGVNVGSLAGATPQEKEQIEVELQRIDRERQEIERLKEDQQDLQKVEQKRKGNLNDKQKQDIARKREEQARQLTERERQLVERERNLQRTVDQIAARRKAELDKLDAAERDRLAEADRRAVEAERQRIERRRQDERARLAKDQDLADDRGDPNEKPDQVRYRGIPASDVPDSVRTALDKYTRGMDDIRYRRELRDDKISYSAHYINPRENKRYWVSINEDGTVNSAPRLSIYQPGTDNDVRKASERAPAERRPAERN